MYRNIALLITVLISASIVLFQPVLSIAAYEASLMYTKRLLETYQRELNNRVRHIQAIFERTHQSMDTCDRYTLWNAEYDHIDIRLIGFINMKTEQICWSRIVRPSNQANLPHVLHTHAITPQSSLHIASSSGHKAVFYESILGDRRWFAVLEKIHFTDNICHHCFEIEWTDKAAHNVKFFKDGRYQVNVEINTFPALFTFKFSAIQAKYESTLRPWLFALFLTTGLLIILIMLHLGVHHRRQRMQLSRAIRRQEVHPYFQPILDSRTGKVTAVEILARWQVKQEVIAPAEFIELAEQSGLIDPLLISLIEQAQHERNHFPQLLEGIVFSFNVTPEQLERPDYMNKLLNLCKNYHSQKQPMALEITERQAFHDLKKAQDILSQFTKEGIGIKLDDTGTGYGSFAYIQQLGFHCIKIDKMFVDTIETENVKRTVLQAIIKFGRTANLEMIAEGVENQAQADFLTSQSVYLHQGYLYAKPLNFSELSGLFAIIAKRLTRRHITLVMMPFGLNRQ